MAFSTLSREGSVWRGTARLSPYAESGLKVVRVYCAGGPFTGEFTVGGPGPVGRAMWLLGAVAVLAGAGGSAALVARRRRRVE
ncbi:hypothetical protein [Acrocarpospora catenulata]|uniref:hypothetical protein n=1 Tax=Acrocarpospora catenulata TaxID=2836182 RepID=UPI001BDAE4BA|nr:hypothetical protein [Acrocarpospora catenulata]